MLDLYYWPTPNGWKITIFLEETGVPYNVVPLNLAQGDQFSPEFLKINPNQRMPAIVDHDGPGGKPISIFESAAILLYLAEKHDKFLSQDPHKKYDAIQWLEWQMGGVGPMFGQAGHFLRSAPEKISYAIERYTNEAKRLCRVADGRLSDREFIAGEYSIADMAIFPWVHALAETVALEETQNLKRWVEMLRARPAVKKGLAVLEDRHRPVREMSEKRGRSKE
jgi:GST-like protein